MLGDYILVTPPTVKRQLSFFGVILTKLGIAVGFLIEGNLGILNIIYDMMCETECTRHVKNLKNNFAKM